VGLTTPPCKKLIVTQLYIEKSRTVSRRRQWHGERIREHYIATWNVRSLYQPGASKKLEEELVKYRTDIAAVQKIRWKLTEMISLKEYILINSGSKKNDYGTVFMVRKCCKPNIMEYKLINERICVLRIRGRFFNTTYISIHAATEEKDTEEKINFMRIWNKHTMKPQRMI
jgi:hypothetical protein